MAEDIRMNKFQIATDADYFYVELADGSQGKIKKSDLVELMRTGIGIAKASKDGLVSFMSLLSGNSKNLYYGVSGGNPSMYYCLAKLATGHYTPSRLNVSFGSWDSTSRLIIDLTITIGGNRVVVNGNGYNIVGYTFIDGILSVYIKVTPGSSFIGSIIGPFIEGTSASSDEPTNIVYIP